MTELIETLLDLARARGHVALPLTRTSTDLGALATEVASEVAAAHPDRAVQVDVHGELGGRWDPARVRQAITSLVVNGLEHGAPQSPVRLSVDGAGEMVVVKVKNDGPAIPSGLRRRCSSRFLAGTRHGAASA
jgi:signal transduction histidine kinase